MKMRNDVSSILSHAMAALSARLSEPSEKLPVTRIFTKPHLARLLSDARKTFNGNSKASSGQLMSAMQQAGLLKKVELDGDSRIDLWRIGFGGDFSDEIDPLELLQAAQPNGVICYFSALVHHELTTQIPTRHHVAILTGSQLPDNENWSSSTAAVKQGSRMFSYAGADFFKTNRTSALVPGTQWVYASSKTMLRVATLEQSLLDAFHRPWLCGGPPVVFEAWERGVETIDEDALADLLSSIGRETLKRRAGCMLDLLGYSVKSARLRAIFDASKGLASAQRGQLLPSVASSEIDPVWNLEIPR